MRVVFDTTILVRAHGKARGSAREALLRIVDSREHLLVLSPYILSQVERVLHYPRLQISARMSQEEITEYVEFLRGSAEIVYPTLGQPVVWRDPTDDPVVFAAVAGHAEVLCSLDRDFYDPEVVAFCHRHRIQIMGDAELLRRLRQKDHG